MSDNRFDSTVTTTCGYCGVGCRLEARARGGRIASISPALDGPANKGHTCLKSRFAHQLARPRNRLTAPLVREGDSFRLARWEGAVGRIVSELTRIKARHGPDAIAGLGWSRATNELMDHDVLEIEAGHVFTAFHFPEVRTKLLVGASADVNTSCPEYKVVAVDVRPVSEAPTQAPALAGAR